MKAIPLAGAALSLLTVSAFGADLETNVTIPAPPVPAAFTWTGCYAGGQVGGGWGQKNLSDSAGILSPITGFTSASLATRGYMLGGQIGCDYQFVSHWVLGIEGEASGGNIGRTAGIALPSGISGDNATFKETTDFLSSATARVGYAWDHWLLYAKGGGAWVGDRYSTVGVFLGAPYDLEGMETRFGWTAGAGFEWALWNDWSLNLEYDYYGFGSRNVTFIDSTSGNVGPANIKQNIQVVKLGLNFHIFADAATAPSKW